MRPRCRLNLRRTARGLGKRTPTVDAPLFNSGRKWMSMYWGDRNAGLRDPRADIDPSGAGSREAIDGFSLGWRLSSSRWGAAAGSCQGARSCDRFRGKAGLAGDCKWNLLFVGRYCTGSPSWEGICRPAPDGLTELAGGPRLTGVWACGVDSAVRNRRLKTIPAR